MYREEIFNAVEEVRGELSALNEAPFAVTELWGGNYSNREDQIDERLLIDFGKVEWDERPGGDDRRGALTLKVHATIGTLTWERMPDGVKRLEDYISGIKGEHFGKLRLISTETKAVNDLNADTGEEPHRLTDIIMTFKTEVRAETSELYCSVTAAKEWASFGNTKGCALDFTDSGLTPYAIKATDGRCHLSKIADGIVPSGEGVLLKKECAADGKTTYKVKAAPHKERIAGNLLAASYSDVKLNPTDDYGNTYYILSSGAMHKFTGQATVGAGKCYLKAPISMAEGSMDPYVRSVTISAVGYATFYDPFCNLKMPSGVKAYVCEGVTQNADEENHLRLKRVEGETLPKGTAVLLEGAQGTYEFEDAGVSLNAEDMPPIGANYFAGVGVKSVVANGDEGLKCYLLQKHADRDYPAFYTIRSAGETIKAGQMVLRLPAEMVANSGLLCIQKSHTQAQQETEFTITANANDADRGTVTGGGTYAANSVITLKAVAEEGFRFGGWSDGNNDNPRTLTVTESMTLTADFLSLV